MFQTHYGHHALLRDSQVSRDEKTLLEEDLKQLKEIPFLPLRMPSDKHRKNHWTWPFIVDLPIENGDFP